MISEVDITDVEFLVWRISFNDAHMPFAVVTDSSLTITQIGRGSDNYKDFVGRRFDDLRRAIHPFWPILDPYADTMLLRVVKKEQ